jgi:Ca2+-binding RTX toxin-like protein
MLLSRVLLTIAMTLGTGAALTASGPASAAGPCAAPTIAGTDRGETLRGTEGPDVIDGRGGDDWVAGGGSPEEPELTPNTVLGGAGGDIVDGSNGDDVLRGGGGNDLLQAGAGRDRVFGGAGDDSANDEIEPGGEPGDQVVDGGPGLDEYPGLAFYDDHHRFQWHARGTIDLAAGTTVVRFPDFSVELPTTGFENASSPRGGRWTIRGTEGDNQLSAGFFHTPVRLYGLGGDDVLYGSDEDDLLDGGPGTDRGVGWGGADRLISIEKGHDRPARSGSFLHKLAK